MPYLPLRPAAPVLLLTLLAAAAHAQVPLLTRSPARNALAVQHDANLTLTFGQPLAPATAANLRVSSAFSGRRVGVTAATGPVLLFDPATDFRPGEVVSVTVPATVRSAAGAPVAAQVYQFTAAAGAASAELTARAATPDLTLPAPAGHLALADMDGDGDLDLLTANYGDGIGNTVSIFLNNGTGQFTPAPVPRVTVGTGPTYIVVADVDNDGDPDLLTANFGLGSGATVSLRLNNGSGGFLVPAGGGGTLTLGPGVVNLAAADVDADGDADLLMLQFDPINNSAQLAVRLNNGNGTFTAPAINPTLPLPATTDLRLADLDNDGDLDLLTSYGEINGFYIRPNDGTGNFGGQPDSVSLNGRGGAALDVGDLDGDGNLDVVLAQPDNNVVGVALNQPGGFIAAGTVPVGEGASGIALADLDGDGDLDVLTTNGGGGGGNTVSVRLNDGTGQFSLPLIGAEVTVGVGAALLAIGDLDGDGTLDCANTNYDSGSVSIRFNTPIVTGLSTVGPAPALNLWPNPAQNTVQIGGAAPGTVLQLRDVLGRVVRTARAAGGITPLDLRGLAPGVYVLEAGAARRRLVVE